MNWLKSKLVKFLIPSEWIQFLNGKKRWLGLIQLLLWALIFVVPAVWPEGAYLAPAALEVQRWLTDLGVNIGTDLLVSGAGFTVVGLIDWITNHFFTDVAIAGTKKVEVVVVKAVTRKPAE